MPLTDSPRADPRMPPRAGNAARARRPGPPGVLRLAAAAAALLLVAGLGPAQAHAASPRGPAASPRAGDPVPGRVVLELTDEGARLLRAGKLELPIPPGGEALEPKLEPMFRNPTDRTRRFALLTFRADRARDPSVLDTEWLDAVGGSPEVLRGEPDRVMSMSALPDDPYFLGQDLLVRQYCLYNPGGLSFNAVRAWPFIPADRRVTVAIIDTGVAWHHSDLGGGNPPDTGVFWINEAERNGAAGVDDDGNGWTDDVIGYDFVNAGEDLPTYSVPPYEDRSDPDPDPDDRAGHGTLVSGFVNALTGNGVGLAGAAPPARIMALRAGWYSSDARALGPIVYMSYCAQALHYAAVNGARVANCSWDSLDLLGLGAALDEAIEDFDMVVVGSAGNFGTNSTGIQYLASREDCLGVAGVLETGVKAGQSDYGAWVDVCGFFSGNPSTWIQGSTGTLGYAVEQGTSFSAPQVTALAALLRAVAPAASGAQVRAWIRDTAQDLDGLNPGYAGQLGTGLVDYAAAVQLAGGGWDAPGDAHGLTPLSVGDGVGLALPCSGRHPGPGRGYRRRRLRVAGVGRLRRNPARRPPSGGASRTRRGPGADLARGRPPPRRPLSRRAHRGLGRAGPHSRRLGPARGGAGRRRAHGLAAGREPHPGPHRVRRSGPDRPAPPRPWPRGSSTPTPRSRWRRWTRPATSRCTTRGERTGRWWWGRAPCPR